MVMGILLPTLKSDWDVEREFCDIVIKRYFRELSHLETKASP